MHLLLFAVAMILGVLLRFRADASDTSDKAVIHLQESGSALCPEGYIEYL